MVGVLLIESDPKSTARRARSFRRNMTHGEQKLWAALRDFKRHYGLHVRRQAPVGPYIADFAIHSRNLIIEVDGEWHYTTEGLARDAKRDRWLNSQGYEVIRFSTGEIDTAFDGCVHEILDRLGLLK